MRICVTGSSARAMTQGKKYVSKAVMQKRLQYYIKEVITHFEKKYPGVIYCWDVVNEAVADQNEGDDKQKPA